MCAFFAEAEAPEETEPTISPEEAPTLIPVDDVEEGDTIKQGAINLTCKKVKEELPIDD